MGLRGLVATLTVEGAVDADRFNAYVGRVLGPRLRSGDVVVLDHLGARRASCIEEVAEGRGAQVLWLAPYSPDFSPIGQCWSKIKSYLRGAKARTQAQLDDALSAAIRRWWEASRGLDANSQEAGGGAWAKDGRNLTSACTRPATRRLSCFV